MFVPLPVCLSQAICAAIVSVLWPSIWASSSVLQRPRSQQATLAELSQRVRLADLVQLTSEMKGFHLNNQTMDHIVLPHTHTHIVAVAKQWEKRLRRPTGNSG